MTFPTQPIADTGTRANEDPLSQSGAWTGSGTQLKIVSNQIVSEGANGASSRVTKTAAGNNEIYYTIADQPGTDQLVSLQLADSNANGYQVNAVHVDGTTVVIVLYRLDTGVATELTRVTGQGDNNGLQFGLELLGTSVNVYYGTVGSSAQLLTVTDNTYRVSFTATAGLSDTTAAIVNFGYGPLVATAVPSIATFMPQAPMIVLPQFRMVPSGTKSGHGIA